MEIIVVIIIIILFYLFFNNGQSSASKPSQVKAEAKKDDIINSSIGGYDNDDILIDEDGNEYYEIQKVRKIPRKTYVFGFLDGKFRGENNVGLSSDSDHFKFYDFEIYEASISNVNTSSIPFSFTDDNKFPINKLPANLPVQFLRDDKKFELSILDPRIKNVQIIRKLHQQEDKEVFGTIKAEITGYLLDFIDEHYTERVYLEVAVSSIDQDTKPRLIKTNTPTGKIESSGNYKRVEYWYDNYKDTYWSCWEYTKQVKSSFDTLGCLSGLFWLIGLLLFIAFIAAIGPAGISILIIAAFIFLLITYFSEIVKWLFRVVVGLLFIGFVMSLIASVNRGNQNTPKPRLVKNETQRDSIVEFDSLIVQHRVWNDYEDNLYEGEYFIRLSDLRNSTNNKNNIPSGLYAYDDVINNLFINDSSKLSSVYYLLDSLKYSKHLNDKQFAEVIVCFVQDIPYSIVLENSCDARFYTDPFTRSYLTNNEGDCCPYSRFGLNTPIEFMSNLKGDCDTRTLFLYTILSHFNYDVAILSSEIYSHSILGINLPYTGDAYITNNKRYVVWETTANGIRPGILPREVSNLNYWRISLQSKY
jgi:hypothetical protein